MYVTASLVALPLLHQTRVRFLRYHILLSAFVSNGGNEIGDKEAFLWEFRSSEASGSWNVPVVTLAQSDGGKAISLAGTARQAREQSVGKG